LFIVDCWQKVSKHVGMQITQRERGAIHFYEITVHLLFIMKIIEDEEYMY
jgi:hypothetical protein